MEGTKKQTTWKRRGDMEYIYFLFNGFDFRPIKIIPI